MTCTAPALGVSGVVFQTYPSLKALYAAYTAKVTALNSNQSRQNFSDCGSRATYGEVGWNHLFKHTRSFTVDQMTMGSVKDDQAAGRVFCNYTQGLERCPHEDVTAGTRKPWLHFPALSRCPFRSAIRCRPKPAGPGQPSYQRVLPLAYAADRSPTAATSIGFTSRGYGCGFATAARRETHYGPESPSRERSR